MKLKQILNESYYDGLYHLSYNKNLTVNNMDNIKEIKNRLPDKPFGGLWLAKGLSWLRWAVDNDFLNNEKESRIYRVRINPKAKIMDLRETSTDIWLEPVGRKNQKFLKKTPKIFFKDIDFEKVAKEYDGVRAYHFMSSTYDVPSVVIFNKNVIQNIEFVDTVENLIKKIN